MARSSALAALLLSAAVIQACTSTESTLSPSAIAPATPPPAAAAPAPVGTGSGTQAAVATTAARVQFAPIVGATVASVAPLTQRLSTTARERGLNIVPAGDPSTTHVVKGYFSAITEGRETIVIYVWDVVDAGGNRVHRLQGQERVPASAAQGWDGVPPAAMEAIADRTVSDLGSWLSGRAG
jgi:hypothetical protein